MSSRSPVQQAALYGERSWSEGVPDQEVSKPAGFPYVADDLSVIQHSVYPIASRPPLIFHVSVRAGLPFVTAPLDSETRS